MAFANTIVKCPRYPLQNVTRMNQQFRAEFHEALDEILDSGNLILGKKVDEFEQTMLNYVGTKYCLGTSSGTASLELALESLDLQPSDEIMIQANTFIASAFGARYLPNKIVPVDCTAFGQLDINEVVKLANEKTKVLIVTHLYGDTCSIEELTNFCKNKNIILIEDCAQAFGTTYGGKAVGSFGDIGCFSCYPSKNLGALGEGGFVTTSDDALYLKMKKLRSLGGLVKYEHEIKGGNKRISAIQAAFMLVKFKRFQEILDAKHQLVEVYKEKLDKTRFVHIRNEDVKVNHSYHLFVIKLVGIDRNAFMKYLGENGIETIINYPAPFHKTEAYRELNDYTCPNSEDLAKTIVSIPLDYLMTGQDIEEICDVINKFGQ